MDCQQVAELLDAYALGAVTEDEARAIEEHLAGCVACWEELGNAQRAASLLALTVPMQTPPAALGDRIMAAAQRDIRAPRGSFSIAGMFSRLQLNWPATVGVFGTAAAAVLVFAVFTQLQVNNLEDDNSKVQAQLAESQVNTADMIRVATADDVQTVSLEQPAATATPATVTPFGADPSPRGEYRWSREEGLGIIFCRNLPPLGDNEVYQAWYQTTTDTVPAGTFEPHNGECFHVMRPLVVVISATGIGVSREQEGANPTRPSRWLIFGRLR